MSGHKGPVFGVVFSPHGRWLATASGDGAIIVWDVATGAELAKLVEHTGVVYGLALSPDGRRLASAGMDRTVNIWDVSGCDALARSTSPAVRDSKASWADLSGTDAALAHCAVFDLSACPEQSTQFLSGRLRPVPGLAPQQREQLTAWVRDLDDGQFQRRERATRELARLGEAARPLLRKSLAGNLSVEGRQRVERLLNDLTEPPQSGEGLAKLRALAVLEHAGTPEAVAVLKTVAAGLPDARLTADAQAALDRLARRPAAP
jgi:hypothetical protein